MVLDGIGRMSTALGGNLARLSVKADYPAFRAWLGPKLDAAGVHLLDRWPAPFDLLSAEEEQESFALLERVDEARAHELTFTHKERSTLA